MKKIVLFIIICTVAAGGVFALLYFNSLKSVTFDIRQPGVTVELYKQDTSQPLEKITSTSTISLQKGEYYYLTRGERYEETRDTLIIENNLTATIDPAFSRSYLLSVLEPQEKNIHNIIKNTYPSVINQYTIHEGELFERGEWYGTILTQKVEDERQITDPYRIVLKKIGDEWTILGHPQIVVTTTNQPDVPIDILRRVNDLLAA